MAILYRAVALAGFDWSRDVAGAEARSLLARAGDGASVPAWAADAFASLLATGVVRGDDKGNLKPQRTITRAETASLLYNIVMREQ